MLAAERLLSGRGALVTGAASGIGAATVSRMTELGARVAAVDRDPAGAEVAASVGARWYQADLADDAGIAPLVSSAVTDLGGIDILVNCAGALAGPATSILEFDAADFDRVYQVNVRAPLRLIQCVARHFIETGRAGRIVNVTSSSAFRAHAPAVYSSSKAALGQITRAAAGELGPYGITVNSVAPGLTATPPALRSRGAAALDEAVRSGPLANLLGRVSEPDDVVNAIVFLCLPESRQITGQTIHTSGGAIV